MLGKAVHKTNIHCSPMMGMFFQDSYSHKKIDTAKYCQSMSDILVVMSKLHKHPDSYHR